ncbi:MAG: hypothetical protein C4532_19930 [Candidatus Abyssobacteria bacterium SURF_17]|uniref:Uncharacterized protein n=1 Tax=Candidatus Abyssobacteria bacterium SURF_17 TaxID=2093361 RepID=A0A419ENB5_9BACT|nr:MAG: hypothetical protein C4532_19930 [Candidatus Abyssubacteria bacterium SURF_17]
MGESARIKLVFALVVVSLSPICAFAESRQGAQPKPDSVYMEQEQGSDDEQGGGLFGFLPFVGDRRKNVPAEELAPSPLPQESKPVLSDKDLGQLRMAADEWLLTSEFTQPKLREDAEGRYYRDYIVFSDEYRVEVLRGDTQERPFLAYVYVGGDYFRTRPSDEPSKAAADFSFDYEPLEFKVVFERVEEWAYSENPNDEPIRFKETWEFRKLQSRLKIDLPEKTGGVTTVPEKDEQTEAQPPANE